MATGMGHDPALQQIHRLRKYYRDGRAPWTRADGAIGFLTVGMAQSPLDRAVSPSEFSELLRCRFAGELAQEATDGLFRRQPADSAKFLTFPVRSFHLAAMALAAGAAFLISPKLAVAYAILAASILFLAIAATRVWLAAIASREPAQPLRVRLPDAALPSVTILAPLFRESHALPGLVQAIDRLDYPKSRIEVKLLLEAGDDETHREAMRLGLDRRFDVMIVPPSHPQTKPKACNYGLACARGELIVIYDAEDEPEQNQLRMAAEHFAAGDDGLACVQAKLNFYNPDETWLTRLFTLEYCLWFDHLLPALDRLGAPVPLGGTSNIFRTNVLAEIGGWDPYNVTEDADLGLRLAERGFRTAVIDSTTYEEANCRSGNWMRQRSRWIKGFMQTWIVHRSRRWSRDWRTVLSVDLFVGGAAIAALLNLPLAAALVAEWASGVSLTAALPPALRWLNAASLVVGNLAFLALAAYAPLRRGLGEISPAALLTPVYWLMMSVAAWRALLQLMTRPSFWEKTDHGLSFEAKSRRAAALQELGLEQAPASRQFEARAKDARSHPARDEATAE